MALIILVEDDDIQADGVRSLLNSQFPRAHVMLVSSESEFYVLLGEGKFRGATALIMDCRLRWGKHSAVPKNILEQGPYRAGVRLIKSLFAVERGREVPVCMRTIVEPQNLEQDLAHVAPGIHYFGKSVYEDNRLVAWAERWLAVADPTIF